jgi:ribosomal protein S18 acetylase RimI-like enzyme
LLLALSGFQQVGLTKAALEVTAENKAAVRLYERCGFRRAKTLYKPLEVVWA